MTLLYSIMIIYHLEKFLIDIVPPKRLHRSSLQLRKCPQLHTATKISRNYTLPSRVASQPSTIIQKNPTTAHYYPGTTNYHRKKSRKDSLPPTIFPYLFTTVPNLIWIHQETERTNSKKSTQIHICSTLVQSFTFFDAVHCYHHQFKSLNNFLFCCFEFV